MILTSNTEATENKVQFFNLAYRVKGFQCRSGCNTQCFDTTGHAPTQTYLRSSLVDNVFSSKYCCARLIAMTKSALTYHRH